MRSFLLPSAICLIACGEAASTHAPQPLNGGAAGASPAATGGVNTGGAGRAGSEPTAASASGGAASAGNGGADVGGISGGGVAGAVEAAAGAGGAAPSCAGVFCESFDGVQPAERWQKLVTGKNQIDQSEGTLRIRYAGTRDTWALLRAPLPPELATAVYGRVRMKVVSPLPERHAVLITAGSEGFPTDEYLEVASVGSTFQLTYVDLKSGGGEDWESGGNIPQARWFCLSFELTDVPEAARIFVDGAEALSGSFSLNSKSSGLIGTFQEVGIGIRVWGSGNVDQPAELLYDDLVLSDAKLDCPAAP